MPRSRKAEDLLSYIGKPMYKAAGGLRTDVVAHGKQSKQVNLYYETMEGYALVSLYSQYISQYCAVKSFRLC
jgi:hypothetical protein